MLGVLKQRDRAVDRQQPREHRLRRVVVERGAGRRQADADARDQAIHHLG